MQGETSDKLLFLKELTTEEVKVETNEQTKSQPNIVMYCNAKKNTADSLRETNFSLLSTAINMYQSQKARAVVVLLEERNGPLPGRSGCVLVLCRWNKARTREHGSSALPQLSKANPDGNLA